MDKFLVDDIIKVRGMEGFFVVMEEIEKSKEGNIKIMNTTTLQGLRYPTALVKSHYRPVKC